MKNHSTFAQEARLTELLFENRNKNYGAYILRKEQAAVQQKAMFIGIAIFAAISLAPLVICAFMTKDVSTVTDHGGFILTPVDPHPEVEPPVLTVRPPAQPQVSTVKIEVPTPTKNPPVETPPPSVTEINSTNIGLENVKGENTVTSYVPPVTAPAAGIPTVQPAPPAVSNEPVTVVDVEASFAGGINTFRTKVVQNFNADRFDGSGDLMRTTVTFIVEKDGSISNIKANGKDAAFNAEAEKTIKKIKGNWTPAKLNGQNVRSYFKFPISMQFE